MRSSSAYRVILYTTAIIPFCSLRHIVRLSRLSISLPLTGRVLLTMRLPYVLSIILPLVFTSIAQPLSLNLPQSPHDILSPPLSIPTTNLTKPQGTWHCDHGSFARSQRVHFGDCRVAILTQLPENGPSRQLTTFHR